MYFALANVEGECYTYRNTPQDRDGYESEGSQASQSTDSSAPYSPRIHRRIRVPQRPASEADHRRDRVIVPFDFVNGTTSFSTTTTASAPKATTSTVPPQRNLSAGTSQNRKSMIGAGGGGSSSSANGLSFSGKSSSGDDVDMPQTNPFLIGDYQQLSGNMVASSFGKLVMKEDPRAGVKEEDLAVALLMMITNNLGQIAYLNARLHGCSKIFFVGSFLRHNSIGCRRLAFAIDFWSGGEMEALFLTHEGYFGALGTFLQSAFGDDLSRVLSQDVRARISRNKESAEKLAKLGATASKDSAPTAASAPSPASYIYGLDHEFLRRLREWKPLSFTAFRNKDGRASESQVLGQTADSREEGESMAKSPYQRSQSKDDSVLNAYSNGWSRGSSQVSNGSGSGSNHGNDSGNYTGYDSGAVSAKGSGVESIGVDEEDYLLGSSAISGTRGDGAEQYPVRQGTIHSAEVEGGSHMVRSYNNEELLWQQERQKRKQTL
ncbi:unnamed protein product [Sphagnum jensenii]|uniref:Uncharacterized protein n=1 Tax=Sphagnum jensenii TaxID=128206 RepID=A0ABP0VBU6_9BRYO